ncbi:MAG TPA: protein kinase [Terriglobia bacterium]|nr:protein kinase [Terriglobia bacterium]
MAESSRSSVQFAIRAVQRPVGWFLILVGLCFAVLFGLQFPHSPKLDEVSLIGHIHRWGDPLITRFASWFDKEWPTPSPSFIPLVVALATWGIKLAVDAIFLQTSRLVGKLMGAKRPVTKTGVYEGAAFGDFAVSADSAKGRDQLLKRYRELEDALKSARRKRCAFLSVDIVGSTSMKQGETETAISATFQAYEEMLKEIFEQHAAWKTAWTPDGVMVCFLQLDLAVAAGQEVLRKLREFNQKHNKLRTSFRVRSGLNEGEVAIFEDSKLEKVVDHTIDVAGHMQKEGRPNALWLGASIYNALGEKTGFRKTNSEVDGMLVYEWSADRSWAVEMPEEAAAGATLGPVSTAAGHPRMRPAGEVRKIGRYEIQSELGRGAMGAVYKARDPQIGRTVAIKIILMTNQSPEAAEEYKQRFYREAQTAGQMSHPGIVTIYDVNEDEYGQPFLVMEFIEGTTLESLLAPAKAGQKKLRPPLKQLIDISSQVADALDYAHRRKVIHRDIKPANILVTSDVKAKIADFGIAKLAGTTMTQTGLLVGTPAFMSPEQITGRSIDSRSDIFSFGIVLYWMFTGKRPFPGDAITEVAYKVVHAAPAPLREVDSTLPLDLDDILSRCLAKKPDERYASAGEITAAFEVLKAKQLVPSTPRARRSKVKK